MNTHKKGALPGALSNTEHAKNSTKQRPGKLTSMLIHFAMGERLHRFEAERIGDHCLHTTVSGLQTKYGIEFNREFTKVPNRFGSQTSVKKYWLEGDQLLKAREIVGLEGAAV